MCASRRLRDVPTLCDLPATSMRRRRCRGECLWKHKYALCETDLPEHPNSFFSLDKASPSLMVV